MKNMNNPTNRTDEYYLTDIGGDNLQEALDFYADFWGGILSNNPSDYTGRVNAPYSGEAIISALTILGVFIRCVPDIYYTENLKMPNSKNSKDPIKARLNLIYQCPSVTDDEKAAFQKLEKIWNSRANFMPLPVGNLNTCKGNAEGKYHDFPDLFYSDLLAGAKGKLKWLFYKDENSAYFAKFGIIEGSEVTEMWKNSFIENNFLQDLFSDDTYLSYRRLSPSAKIVLPYNDKIAASMCDTHYSCCQKHMARKYVCQDFLPAAVLFIKNRAKRFANK